MRRVTGIGGIFMCPKVPKALCDWYKKPLGILGAHEDAANACDSSHFDLRCWLKPARVALPTPNDIEFSGERKRVRCNEGLDGCRSRMSYGKSSGKRVPSESSCSSKCTTR